MLLYRLKKQELQVVSILRPAILAFSTCINVYYFTLYITTFKKINELQELKPEINVSGLRAACEDFCLDTNTVNLLYVCTTFYIVHSSYSL